MSLIQNLSHFIKLLLLGLIYLGLSSCSSIESSKPSNNFYQLQPIPLTLRHKVYLESLTLKQPENRQLLTQIEISERELSLAAMTYSGIAIMQAQWHENKGLINFSSQVFDKGMLLRIIRDIQLVKWPENSIKAGLLAGYQLTSRNQGVKLSREIIKKDKVVVSIIYTQKKVVLTNLIDNYELVIENIDE